MRKYLQDQLDCAGFDDPPPHQKEFYRLAREWIPSFTLTNKRVLDVGCNRGYEIDYWHKLFENLEGYGIDIYFDALKTGREFYNFVPIQADFHYLPFKENTFDFVHAREVLEHSWTPQRSFEEIHRVLKKNGIFFGWLPLIEATSKMHNWKVNEVGLRDILKRFSFKITKFEKFKYSLLLPERKLSKSCGVRFLVTK